MFLRTIVCLVLLCGGMGAQAIPVLVYHRFDPSQAAPMTVRTSTFQSQILWLQEHHYRIVPLHAVIGELHNHSVGEKEVTITVDDGHRSVFTEMFPVIVKYHIPVTLFIYPSAISNASYALTWEQIKQMQASGLVEVQSHTYWHPNFRRERARLSPAEYDAFVTMQLVRSKDVLQKRLGIKIDALAWPCGIYDSSLEEAARHAGYDTAFAFAGGSAHAGCDLLAIPRIPISDSDTGSRFSLLLADSQAKTKKE